MSLKAFAHRLISATTSLAVVISSISLGSAAHAAGPSQNERIFPGQKLPAGIPLRADATGSAPVQLSSRDWFLLAKPDLLIASRPATAGQIADYRGPMLTDNNAQLYFHLVAGMVLKETLVQLGMKPVQAKLLVDKIKQSGRNFDSVPIAELGDLPRGIDDLYEKWDRPMARMMVIPYLILPLATVNSESSFQQFFTTHVINESQDKKCSNMRTVNPIAAVQNRIDERLRKQDELVSNLRRATDLSEQSAREVSRLTGMVNNESTEVDQRSACLNAFQERISRGAAMPSAACLQTAAAIATAANLSAQWTQFTTSESTYLNNPNGDYNDRQAAELALHTLESRLTFDKQSVAGLTENKDKAVQDLAKNQDTIKKLQNDRKMQTDQTTAYDNEEKTLKAEYLDLQELKNKLARNAVTQEMPDSEVQAANNTAGERSRRMEAITARLSALANARKKLQISTASILTQLEFLNRKNDDDDAQIRSADTQLDPKAGLPAEIISFQAQVDQAKTKYLKTLDAYNFSYSIISALSHDVATLSQAREADAAALKKEEANGATLKLALNAANAAKDGAWEGVKKEIGDLNAKLAYYRSDKHMGWYLEQDCASREEMGPESQGVFLSRAPIAGGRVVPAAVLGKFAAPVKSDPSTVEGGRWGLFNIDYAHFQNSIDSGVLLNLNDTIRLGVQYSIQNLNFAIDQYMDQKAAARCKGFGAPGNFSASVMDLMGTAFALWNEGSDDQAKANLCKSSDAKISFVSSLNKFLLFDGTVLDQALAKTGDGLIERQAIIALNTEMRDLAGISKDPNADVSNKRRDDLVRSLIKILAYDYDGAVLTSQDLETKMPAAALIAPERVAANASRQVTGVTTQPSGANVKSCPLRRLVTAMQGISIVPRSLPELKTVRSDSDNSWRLSATDSGKAAPAMTKKTYVACELFSQPGKVSMLNAPATLSNQAGVDLSQVLGVRIVEVQKVEGEDGTVQYKPMEDYGGFVSTWVNSDGPPRVRVTLGPQLDDQWSVVR